ncbi:DUF305 domain-containing protein [Streptomyces olivochromogenes]|uniref:DUF305 domain-containing protein n=1 Tax=Streptomyces olivochromogenes TaxID=1963 RepID=UPI001F218242|nr:DUF305 domain-containing protein [Streptomyces olivochromogenes]MCF3130894.1 DUF305 domain-containing protein [Streptomyces olivochromogenes]
MTTRTPARRAALVAVLAAAALLLAACGGEDHDSAGHTGHGASASPSAGAEAHNAQDVSFAQGMIPHHRQALEMAALAADRASSVRVKDLAARIQKAQDPEIRTMTGWLTSWGEDVPMAGTDHSHHSGMSGMPGMSGMMSAKDMDRLKKASGKEFDTMFLTMMIDHHRGAVAMATTEKDEGRYGPATSTADDIVTAQNGEIKEMNQLLGAS